MSIFTEALYDILANDATLTSMLSKYKGQPAIFTTDPAPGDADLPYIVTAGDVSHVPFDTKNSRGRNILRDIRCYTAETGSVILVVSIAERVRKLLHRKEISVDNWVWILSEVTGPIAADEADTYGRIVTLRAILAEDLYWIIGVGVLSEVYIL